MAIYYAVSLYFQHTIMRSSGAYLKPRIGVFAGKPALKVRSSAAQGGRAEQSEALEPREGTPFMKAPKGAMQTAPPIQGLRSTRANPGLRTLRVRRPGPFCLAPAVLTAPAIGTVSS